MKKTLLTIFTLVILTGLTTMVFAGGQSEEQNGEGSGKFALILATGGLGDQSFNDLTYQGLERAEKELDIRFDYVEPKEIADYEVYQRDMADTGEYGLIICVGFDQADALAKVAEDYPEQNFAIIDMVVDKPNVASYVSKEEQGSFLVGAIAGLVEKEQALPGLNKAPVTGVVGGMDIPLIRKFVAGYMAGAKYVYPEMEVLSNYVGGWSDPTTAKEISNTMYSRDADIIYHAAGGSGLGVFKAAEEEDKYAIGVNSNQNSISPDHIIASMLKRVDNACFQAVNSVLNDNFEPGIHALGIDESDIGYSTEGSNIDVPENINSQVESLKDQIEEGSIVVPTDIDQVPDFLSENS